jgi:hypothetical protein
MVIFVTVVLLRFASVLRVVFLPVAITASQFLSDTHGVLHGFQ